MKTVALLVAMIYLACSALAQQSSPATSVSDTAASGVATASEPSLQSRNPRWYKIGPGDSMELIFRYSPEFNQTLTVQPDGFVTLNEIGDVHVQDLTIPEATEALRQAAARILKDPVVTVLLKDFDKPFFIANGEVKNPGRYELRSNLTITEAIAIAGGFTEASKHSQVWLYRRLADGRMEAHKLDLKRMLKAGDLREDARLHPGDMIFVPQNTLSKLKGFVIPKSSVGPSVGVRP